MPDIYQKCELSRHAIIMISMLLKVVFNYGHTVKRFSQIFLNIS